MMKEGSALYFYSNPQLGNAQNINDLTLESIKVDQRLIDRGFLKRAEEVLTFNYPSRGNIDELSLIRQTWVMDASSPQERPRHLVLTFGYFPDLEELSRAWTGYQVRTNRPHGRLTKDEEVDLLVDRLPTHQIFSRGMFLVEVQNTIFDMRSEIETDEGEQLVLDIRAAILEKIASYGSPRLPDLEVTFETSQVMTDSLFQFSYAGGHEVGYSYLIRQDQQIVADIPFTPVQSVENLVYLESLSPGSYSLSITVSDSFGRIQTSITQFTVPDSKAAVALEAPKDAVVQGANPTLSLNHQETPLVAFDLANTDLTGLAKVCLRDSNTRHISGSGAVVKPLTQWRSVPTPASFAFQGKSVLALGESPCYPRFQAFPQTRQDE